MISPNFDTRPAGSPIDHLVLHYTGMRTADAARARLCDPDAKVSAHYLIDEDGAIFPLVREDFRAWHAGVSYWRGLRNLNDRSIGVELVNPGHMFGYVPFPDAQIEALIRLCNGIFARHPINPRNVVGHSDIAPDRKQDPGEKFPWAVLAEAGIGCWTEALVEPGDIVGDLAAIGYDVSLDPGVVVSAFQRRFRPGRIDGRADNETRGRAASVRRLFGDD